MASCDNCNKGSILPGEPKGTIDPSTGAYLAKAPDQSRTERAVLLLTDAFGLPLKNSKIIADVLSEHLGCDVWIPDIFDGTYFPHFGRVHSLLFIITDTRVFRFLRVRSSTVRR